jgi:hypothetical protein
MSAVAVQSPDRYVPGSAQLVAQDEHVRFTPLVPSEVVPALQAHLLPSAAQVVPGAEHVQVLDPFTVFVLPAGQAKHAKAGGFPPVPPPGPPPEETVVDQPKPAAQEQEVWPGRVLPAGKNAAVTGQTWQFPPLNPGRVPTAQTVQDVAPAKAAEPAAHATQGPPETLVVPAAQTVQSLAAPPAEEVPAAQGVQVPLRLVKKFGAHCVSAELGKDVGEAEGGGAVADAEAEGAIRGAPGGCGASAIPRSSVLAGAA